MTARGPTAPSNPSTARDRLLWRLEIAGEGHVIEILPDLLGRGVGVYLDSRRQSTISKPTVRRPWQLWTGDVHGTEVAVALTVNPLATMSTELFVNGRSTDKGRTIEEARRSAPLAVGAYEAWFRGGITGISTLRLAPTWVVVSAFLAAASLVGAVIARRGPIAASLFALGAGLLLAVFLRTWFILTARANRYLMARPEWGDVLRTVLLGLAFVLPPTAFLTAGAIFVYLAR